MIREATIGVIAGLVAIILAIGVSSAGWLAVAPIVPLAGWAMWQSATVRFAIVTFGGLFVLQSSAGFDTRKQLYFACCLMALGIAWFRTRSFDIPILNPVRRKAELLSWAWVAVVCVSFMVAVSQGTNPTLWLRDVIPYLLLASMPFLAMDLLMDLERNPWSSQPTIMFVVFGILGTIGFSAHWITQRQYGDLPIDNIVFSSFAIPGAVFCFAVARAIHSDHARLPWALLATSVLILVMMTGTRSSIILLAAPMVMVMGLGIQRIGRVARFVSAGLVAVAAGLVMVLVLPDTLGIDSSVVIDRYASLGDLTGQSVAGQSFTERETVTRVTWEALRSSPIFGMGPGYIYEWPVPYSRELQRSFNLDSPLAIAAKFGVLGIMLMILTAAALFGFQRYLSRLGEPALAQRDTIRAFLTITILISMLGSPIDDKGFSFSLAFLVVAGGQVALQKGKQQPHATTGFHPDTLLQPGTLAARQPSFRGEPNIWAN